MDFRTLEEDVDCNARMARITGLIETLPPKLQAVLILQFRDGLTYEEIAVHLDVITHAVKICDQVPGCLPRAPDEIRRMRTMSHSQGQMRALTTAQALEWFVAHRAGRFLRHSGKPSSADCAPRPHTRASIRR